MAIYSLPSFLYKESLWHLLHNPRQQRATLLKLPRQYGAIQVENITGVQDLIEEGLWDPKRIRCGSGNHPVMNCKAKSMMDSVWRKLKTLSDQQQADQFLKDIKNQAPKRQKEKKANDASGQADNSTSQAATEPIILPTAVPIPTAFTGNPHAALSTDGLQNIHDQMLSESVDTTLLNSKSAPRPTDIGPGDEFNPRRDKSSIPGVRAKFPLRAKFATPPETSHVLTNHFEITWKDDTTFYVYEIVGIPEGTSKRQSRTVVKTAIQAWKFLRDKPGSATLPDFNFNPLVNHLNTVISKSLSKDVFSTSSHRFYFKNGHELLGNSRSLCIMRGYDYTVKPAMEKVLLNVNAATSAFFRPITVAEFLADRTTFTANEVGKRIKRLKVYVVPDRKSVQDLEEQKRVDDLNLPQNRIKTIKAFGKPIGDRFEQRLKFCKWIEVNGQLQQSTQWTHVVDHMRTNTLLTSNWTLSTSAVMLIQYGIHKSFLVLCLTSSTRTCSRTNSSDLCSNSHARSPTKSARASKRKV
jgi:hypothetical protein